jgi:hypothetical protein
MLYSAGAAAPTERDMAVQDIERRMKDLRTAKKLPEHLLK